MKNLFFLVFLITFSCGSDDCNSCHYSVEIINNSDKTLYYEFAPIPSVGSDPSLAGNYFKINPHSSKKDNYGGERGSYEDRFKLNNIVYYNIYDSEIVESVDWETIRENDLILERQSFTLQQMNEANWQLIYNE